MGTTRELISWALCRALTGAALPQWRLSVAQLSGAAAFSPLTGVGRIFVPVGTGVSLVVNGIERRVSDRSVTTFAGGDAVHLAHLDRPGHAVNLMYRTTGNGDAPVAAVGHTGDAAFATCLLAVALAGTPGIDRFDVLAPGTPGGTDPQVPAVPVLLIWGTGRAAPPSPTSHRAAPPASQRAAPPDGRLPTAPPDGRLPTAPPDGGPGITARPGR